MIRGTVKQLMARGLTFKGVPVSPTDLSVLSKFGLCTLTGYAEKDAKAKERRAGVYECLAGFACTKPDDDNNQGETNNG